MANALFARRVRIQDVDYGGNTEGDRPQTPQQMRTLCTQPS